MKKIVTHFLGLSLLGSIVALSHLDKSMIFTKGEGEIDNEYSYNLAFYDDFNGQLKNGWSYVKGGSSYTYVEESQTKYGWLFNGQDHVQYKRNNNPSDFGKFLYGDSTNSNYVFEMKIKADTNMTAGEYFTTYKDALGANLTINSMIPFFVQNQEPSSSYQDFYGRAVCFSNYAIGFWEYDNAGKGAWTASIRLNTKIGPDFTWADWHTIRVLANDTVCKLFVDDMIMLETPQSSFKKATATTGPCGFAATVKTGYDSLHYDDFKFYKANPNYMNKIEKTTTFDLLDSNKFKSAVPTMNYTKNGNKVGFSIPTGGKYETQLSTFNQGYENFDMDIAVDLDNQLTLKGITSEDKITDNIRVSAESGIVVGAGGPNAKTGNYYLVSTELIHKSGNSSNVSNVRLLSFVGGKRIKAAEKEIAMGIAGTAPYLRLSLRNKKLSVTVFANKEDYESQAITKTVENLDLSANTDGNQFGFRCAAGGDQKLIYEMEILSFSTTDKGGIEYPSSTAKIAPEENNGPYTVFIPSLTNGAIKDGEVIITSDISMNAHTSKTLSVIPNEGYSISKVLVNGKNIGPAKEIKIDNITRNTTIEVEFVSSSTIDVYLLAGQSNAAGYTPINGLFKEYTYGGALNQSKIEEYQNGYDNVYYYGTTKTSDVTKGNMKLDVVRAGEGNAASYMGPELGFGEYISPILAKQHRQAAVIKYAIGSTGFANSSSSVVSSFGNWLSPTSLEEESEQLVEKSGLLYKNLLEVTKSGLTDLINRGYKPIVKGLMWFQGCADAGSKTLSEKYAHHLTNLINDLRKDIATLETELSLEEGYLTVVAGKINDNLNGCEYENIVREQIQLVSETTEGVRVIDTKGMTVPDPNDNNDRWHFSSKDMLKIGNMFGQVLMEESGYVTPETYTVTFDSDGGTSINSQTLKKWESVKIPATPEKEGYIFVKWVEEGSENAFNFEDYSITENLTLKAIYKAISGYDDYQGFITLTNTTLRVENGEVKEPTADEWASLKSAFLSLGESYKTALKEAAASNSGSDLEKALFLYDSVLNKFGSEKFENFLDRPVNYAPVTPEEPSTDPEENKSGNTGVIVASSVGGALAIAGIAALIIYFIKKKK